MDKTVIIVDLKTADLETQDLFTEAQLKEFLCVIHRGEEQKQSQQYVGQQRARSKYTPAGYKVCWYHSLESFWVSVLMSICFWQPPPPVGFGLPATRHMATPARQSAVVITRSEHRSPCSAEKGIQRRCIQRKA